MRQTDSGKRLWLCWIETGILIKGTRLGVPAGALKSKLLKQNLDRLRLGLRDSR